MPPASARGTKQRDEAVDVLRRGSNKDDPVRLDSELHQLLLDVGLGYDPGIVGGSSSALQQQDVRVRGG